MKETTKIRRGIVSKYLNANQTRLYNIYIYIYIYIFTEYEQNKSQVKNQNE